MKIDTLSRERSLDSASPLPLAAERRGQETRVTGRTKGRLLG